MKCIKLCRVIYVHEYKHSFDMIFSSCVPSTLNFLSIDVLRSAVHSASCKVQNRMGSFYLLFYLRCHNPPSSCNLAMVWPNISVCSLSVHKQPTSKLTFFLFFLSGTKKLFLFCCFTFYLNSIVMKDLIVLRSHNIKAISKYIIKQ